MIRLAHGRSINMGETTPLSHPTLVGLRRITLLWCVSRGPGRQVVHRHHSNLAYSIPSPLTPHSCIAKHHLVLFCLQQSQLTKKTIITAVAKQKPNKGCGGGESGGGGGRGGKVRLKSSAEKKKKKKSSMKWERGERPEAHWMHTAEDFCSPLS